jgi:hypothetical protein
MEMQGLKPSILMGKLKQHLPYGVSPDNGLFLSMFLIRLLPSMREAEGARIHKTALATIRAADALWDARGDHNPMITAATTQRSKSPAPTSGKKIDKRNGNARSKRRPPSGSTSFLFRTPAMACASFTTSTATKHTSAFSRVPGGKTKALPNPYRFSRKLSTCHCHSHAFPSKCRPHFSHGRIG